MSQNKVSLTNLDADHVNEICARVNTRYMAFSEPSSLPPKTISSLMAIAVFARVIDGQLNNLDAGTITDRLAYDRALGVVNDLHIAETLYGFLLIDISKDAYSSDSNRFLRDHIGILSRAAEEYLKVTPESKWTLDMIVTLQHSAYAFRNCMTSLLMFRNLRRMSHETDLAHAVSPVCSITEAWLNDDRIKEWTNAHSNIPEIAEFAKAVRELHDGTCAIMEYKNRYPELVRIVSEHDEAVMFNAYYDVLYSAAGSTTPSTRATVKAAEATQGIRKVLIEAQESVRKTEEIKVTVDEVKEETVTNDNGTVEEEVIVEEVVEEELPADESTYEKCKGFFNRHKPSKKVMIWTGAAVAATAAVGGVIWYRRRKSTDTDNTTTA